MVPTSSKKPVTPSKTSSPTKKVKFKKNHTADFETDPKPFDAALEDLFKSDLKDMLWSENHLVASIPKMIDATKTAGLKKALTSHLKETVRQIGRLKSVFEQLNLPAVPKKCHSMEGLIMSGEHTIDNTLPGSPGRETGLINSGIKVEQFEIICYNTLIKMATKLGYTDAVKIFTQNLQEEVAASDKLNLLSDIVSMNLSNIHFFKTDK